jgi:methylated-DNA-[protein]-cysteine S-methyltransferase
MRLWMDELDSPVGLLALYVIPSNGALCALEFESGKNRQPGGTPASLQAHFGTVEIEPMEDPCGYTSRMIAYLDGDMTGLDSIPVDAHGTPFQKTVWNALRQLRAGETTSYGALAIAIGRPGASRAVGLANGSNPVAIVVPCHRVIGANGTLTGYGGGLERKRWLLDHERAHAGRSRTLFDAVQPRTMGGLR